VWPSDLAEAASVRERLKAQLAAGGNLDPLGSNFRDDVNANGVITNADVSLTKAQVAAGATTALRAIRGIPRRLEPALSEVERVNRRYLLELTRQRLVETWLQRHTQP